MKAKRYIPLLITIALLSLICLQIVWLFSVYEYKKQELKDKTQESLLETAKRLEKQEDSKIILENIDSLLVSDEIIGSDSKEITRVIVSNIKNKLKIDTIKGIKEARIEKKIKIINDSSSSTTVIKVGGGKDHNIVVQTESNQTRIKKRAGDLQALFMKMALNAGDPTAYAAPRVDSANLLNTLTDELLKRGIDLLPEVGLFYRPNENGSNPGDSSMLFSTAEFKKTTSGTIVMPIFEDDIIGGGSYILRVSYLSPNNFIIKQMMGLLILSLLITILIGFVMIYLFKRMLSQEKLHQLKNDFINNMTHELKTPIATISLAVDGISNPAIKNDEAKFNNYTAILKEENKKLNNHVERVLQMALLEKGELHLDKKSINLKSLLENCIHTQQLQIQNKNAKVVLTAEELTVNGDEFHLMNAFTNLLDNALKYSGENCEITISLNKQGEIRFKDNGIGIDKAIQEKVFEKFFRAQGGNLHDVKGFGLGLSYVKSIIEAHGGTIELRSEKNKGSEFIIKLRVNEA